MRWKPILAVAGLLAAVLVALGFFWLPFPFRKEPETLRLPGVVEIQEVRLGSKIGGRVAEVLVYEGDIVQPEQVVVRFEAPELEAQRAQWQARLEQAQAEWEKAENGPRREEIAAAKSEWESAEADFKLAREDFERMEKLYPGKGASRAEYDAARGARDRAKARAAAVKARLDLLLAGTRPEEKAEAKARVAEHRAKLKEIDANLREATVRAAEEAVVEVVAVRKGDLVPASQPVVRVLRAADLWVRVYVPETDLGKVVKGQTVSVTVDAYPDRQFTGRIIQIAAESEFTPRNVQSVDERRHQVFGMKIRVDDPQGVFKAGMAAEVTIPLKK